MYNELDPGFRPKSTSCFFQRSRKIIVWPWMKPLQDEVFRLNRGPKNRPGPFMFHEILVGLIGILISWFIIIPI